MIQELFGQAEQKKTCRKLQHVKRYMERNMSKIIRCLTAVGKNYNSTRDNISEDIAKKATKIYEKQIRKNKVLPYHCDYRKLEQALAEYKKAEKND